MVVYMYEVSEVVGVLLPERKVQITQNPLNRRQPGQQD